MPVDFRMIAFNTRERSRGDPALIKPEKPSCNKLHQDKPCQDVTVNARHKKQNASSSQVQKTWGNQYLCQKGLCHQQTEAENSQAYISLMRSNQLTTFY